MKWKIGLRPVKPKEYLTTICDYYQLYNWHNPLWIASHYDSQLILQNIKYPNNFCLGWHEYADDRSHIFFNGYNTISIFNVKTLEEFKEHYPFVYMIDNRNIHDPVCALFVNKQQKAVKRLITLANKNLAVI